MPWKTSTLCSPRSGVHWSMRQRIASGFYIEGPRPLAGGRLLLAGEYVDPSRAEKRMRVPEVMKKHRPRELFTRNHAFFGIDTDTAEGNDLVVVIQPAVGRSLHDRGRSRVARHDATCLDGTR